MNDAEVFDLCRRLLGVGNWDEDLDREPWHKARMREISKIKAMRTKRRMSPEDIALVVKYCASQRIPISKAYDLLEYWPQAVRWRTANERLQAGAEQRSRRERALEVERRRPDGGEWVGRLLRAHEGQGLEALLTEWTRERDT